MRCCFRCRPGQGVTTGDARPLSLAEAVRLAQQNSPSTVQARGQIRTSDAAIRSAYGAFLPSLNISSAATPGPRRRHVRSGASVVTDRDEPWNFSAASAATSSCSTAGAASTSCAARGARRSLPRRTSAAEVQRRAQRQAAVLQHPRGPRIRGGGATRSWSRPSSSSRRPPPASPRRRDEVGLAALRHSGRQRAARAADGARTTCASPTRR